MKKYIPIVIGLLAAALLLAFAARQGRAQEASPENGRQVNPEAPTSRSSYIPVQGRLTDASGNPLTGLYDLTFNLYETYSGGTALCTDTATDVSVKNGLFNAYMNMQGCSAIDGRQLYLGIQVGTDPEMTPRQYIDNVIYAWTLRPGANISGTIGGEAILDIDNYSPTARGLRAEALATTGLSYAVIGASRSVDGYGGYFYNNGGGFGLYGSTSSSINFGVIGLQGNYVVGDLGVEWESGGYFGGTNGVVGISHETVRVGAGVFGWAQATTGSSYGVRGRADSTTSYGVFGQASSSTGSTRGVYGLSQSTAGSGVYGLANATSGATYGVYGETDSPSGKGVYGVADSSGGGIGVHGVSEAASGVYGESTAGYGVYGHTDDAGNNYGFYTPDNSYSLNYHTKGAMMQIVKNGGSDPLEPGDVAVFSGVIPPADANEQPVILVSKAAAANSTAVAGVVYSRYSLEKATVEGAAQPGEYLLLVVQGPARVKASAAGGAIQPGDLLSSGAQVGLAAKAAMLPGAQAGLPGTVFAKALEALVSGEGWIYVFVTLQ